MYLWVRQAYGFTYKLTYSLFILATVCVFCSIPLSYFEDKEASCMNAHYKVAPSADIKQKCNSLVFER